MGSEMCIRDRIEALDPTSGEVSGPSASVPPDTSSPCPLPAHAGLYLQIPKSAITRCYHVCDEPQVAKALPKSPSRCSDLLTRTPHGNPSTEQHEYCARQPTSSKNNYTYHGNKHAHAMRKVMARLLLAENTDSGKQRPIAEKEEVHAF